MFVRMA